MSQPSQPESNASHEYPAGHLHHLTPAQAQALSSFKTLAQESGHYRPAAPASAASHDDETLLRFLRARRFVPEDALQQFSKTEEWRREQEIDSWYDTIDVEEFEATRVLYTHWTGRRDKRGIPLYVFKIGSIDIKKLLSDSAADRKQPAAHSSQISPKLRRLFATYEHLTTFVMPLCSLVPDRPHRTVPVSQTTCIVDITGVSLFQFLRLKSHLQEASALATAHYPETLGRTFVVGAPSFFATIWGWLQYWFDPITVAKILILGPGEVEGTLARFVDVEDVPRAYGGRLEWEFGDAPNVDPGIVGALEWKEGRGEIPKGSVRWRERQGDGVVEAVALGTEGGKRREFVFATASKTRASADGDVVAEG